MPNLEVNNLFNENRFSESIIKIIYLLLYTPLGLIILLLRILCGIIALLLASALPDVSTLRTTITNLFSFCFGIFIKKQDCHYRDRNVKIIVSNHISRLDHLALHIAANSYTPTKYRMQDVLENALGLIHINRNITSDEIINSDKVLAFFPEEAITNGRGLLKFNTKIFDCDINVQPVALRIWRPPIAEVAVKSLGSQWWSDVMSYLFVPYTLYTVQFLPVIKKQQILEDQQFVEVVRNSIANSLKIPKTNITARDMIEYEKRYLMDQRRAMLRNPTESPSTSRNTRIDPNLEMMARQVKEVLPLVPQHVIIQDLTKTRNIDYTISNILDGHVRYTPETPITPTTQQTSTPSTSSSNESFMSTQQKQINFPKSANARMQSFQERKRELIENARKKYIEKHGLNIALNNC